MSAVESHVPKRLFRQINIQGHRNLLFALVVVGTVTLTLMTRFLEPAHYVSIMTAVIYGFLGASALEKVAEKVQIGVRKTDGTPTSPYQP